MLGEIHSIMCALKHGSIQWIACCVQPSLHILTIYFAFPYMEAQNCVSATNSYSCPFPNVSVLCQTIYTHYVLLYL